MNANTSGYSFTMTAGRYRLSHPEGDITCQGPYFTIAPKQHLHQDLLCSIP